MKNDRVESDVLSEFEKFRQYVDPHSRNGIRKDYFSPIAHKARH